jgi:hypothetical protein
MAEVKHKCIGTEGMFRVREALRTGAEDIQLIEDELRATDDPSAPLDLDTLKGWIRRLNHAVGTLVAAAGDMADEAAASQATRGPADDVEEAPDRGPRFSAQARVSVKAMLPPEHTTATVEKAGRVHAITPMDGGENCYWIKFDDGTEEAFVSEGRISELK